MHKTTRALPQALPSALPGFEHINRYWDHTRRRFAAKILPGDYYVTVGDEFMTTVLGSCISACIRDRGVAIGGMNHFMLPQTSLGGKDAWTSTSVNAATRYGSFAMEHMINTILKYGGNRENLEVKIVGGGQILANMTDIGQRNIEFVREYIRAEGLTLCGEDVGDIYPRKVVYDPATGKGQVRKLRFLQNDTIIERENRYRHTLEEKPVGGEVELF